MLWEFGPIVLSLQLPVLGRAKSDSPLGPLGTCNPFGLKRLSEFMGLFRRKLTAEYGMLFKTEHLSSHAGRDGVPSTGQV
jgi:hypothetical protein